jgi:hypothetical protein
VAVEELVEAHLGIQGVDLGDPAGGDEVGVAAAALGERDGEGEG